MKGDLDDPAPGEPFLDDPDTGLPWPRTWRGVYLLVGSVFCLWVLLLALLPFFCS